MPIVSQGASLQVTIPVGDSYTVTSGGDAYVDLLSGAPGSPYSSPRLRAPTESKTFGPYPEAAVIRVRAVIGSAQVERVLPSAEQRVVELTAAEVAAPSAAVLADTTAVYKLNVAPFTRYTSNGTTLTAAGAAFSAPQLASLADTDGSQIGLLANVSEVSGDKGRTPNSQVLKKPRLATPPATVMDVGAFWYNDFGLEWTRLNASTSWMGWYDWRWNWLGPDGYRPNMWVSTANYTTGQHVYGSDGYAYTALQNSTSGSPKDPIDPANSAFWQQRTDSLDPSAWVSTATYSALTHVKGSDGKLYMALQTSNSGNPRDPTNPANAAYWRVRPEAKYYPDRHPTLGWYRGDDPKVIGWQIKWLVEHGCSWAIAQQRALQPDDGGNWTSDSSIARWVYHGINDQHTKAGLFKWAFWLPNCAPETAGPLTPINGEYSASTAYTVGMRVCVTGTPTTYYRCILNAPAGTAVSNATYWLPIPTFNNASAYAINDVVRYDAGSGAKFYRCKVATVANAAGQTPTSNGTYWNVISDYNSAESYLPGMVVVANTGDNRQYIANGTGTGLGAPTGVNPNWTVRPMPASWTTFADFHIANKDRVKTFTVGGKVYPVLFVWDADTIRVNAQLGTFGEWLNQLGAYLKAAVPEWTGGAAMLMRNSPSPTPIGVVNYDTIEAPGNVLLLRTDYPGATASTGATQGENGYQTLIDNFGPTFATTGQAARLDRRIYTVPTALQAVAPHDTTANYAGHAPAKFEAFMRKGRDHAAAGKSFLDGNGRPQILVYNVAEWAEAGPGLQPNMQDGFGYLTAMKNAIT